MTRAANIQKIRTAYPLTEQTESVAQEMHDLVQFIHYYEIDAALLKPYNRVEQREELEWLTGFFNNDKTPVAFDEILSGAREPVNDTEQMVLNVWGILKSLDTVKEEINTAYLQKMQAALQHMMLQNTQGAGLRLESNSLFGAARQDDEVLDMDVREWLEDILKITRTKDIHYQVRAFLFYYLFRIIKPFESNNELLAYLVCKKILVSEKANLFASLNPGKYVFRNQEVMASLKLLEEATVFEEKIYADISGYLSACIHGFRNNIIAIKETAMQVVREQLEYQTLTPRQKNSLNFWLEKGFFLHKERLEQLTPRQHEIMLLIAKYGSLSNKDLVPVFMVDRKTIQRDFNTLLDIRLLEQRGGGRALKYYLNLRLSL